MTKVTIYGAGAVGGNVAVRLASAGVAEVAVVARGAHLEAIKTRGLTLRRDGQDTTARMAHATDDPSTLEPQDLVIVTLKSVAIPAVAAQLAALRKPEAPILFLINGIPWWWNHGLPADHPAAGASVDLLDPGRALRDTLGEKAALGGVIYSPNEVIEPGLIVNRTRSRFSLGEPDGSSSARLAFVRDLFAAANIEVSTNNDLRGEVLGKLALNASGNTLAALTRLTGLERLSNPGTRELTRTLIHEVLRVAAALGWPLDDKIDVDAMTDPKRTLGERPSMLQDVLAGRPMEVEALQGQLQVLARLKGIPTPTIDLTLTLLRGLDISLRRGN